LSREGRDEPEFIVPVPADSAPIGCATLRRCRAGTVEDLQDRGTEANVYAVAGELVGDAEEVALDLDVVVNADAGYPVRGWPVCSGIRKVGELRAVVDGVLPWVSRLPGQPRREPETCSDRVALGKFRTDPCELRPDDADSTTSTSAPQPARR
jgi:hypothetical protein